MQNNIFSYFVCLGIKVTYFNCLIILDVTTIGVRMLDSKSDQASTLFFAALLVMKGCVVWPNRPLFRKFLVPPQLKQYYWKLWRLRIVVRIFFVTPCSSSRFAQLPTASNPRRSVCQEASSFRFPFSGSATAGWRPRYGLVSVPSTLSLSKFRRFQEGSQHLLYSVFCGLLVSISYHLSRQTNDPVHIW